MYLVCIVLKGMWGVCVLFRCPVLSCNRLVFMSCILLCALSWWSAFACPVLQRQFAFFLILVLIFVLIFLKARNEVPHHTFKESGHAISLQRLTNRNSQSGVNLRVATRGWVGWWVNCLPLSLSCLLVLLFFCPVLKLRLIL
jgi:hypothetical protein